MTKCIAFVLIFIALLSVVGCGSSNPAENPDFVLAKTKLEAAIASRDAAVAKVAESRKMEKETNFLNFLGEIENAKDPYRSKILTHWRAMADAYIRAGGKANDLPHQGQVNGVVKDEYGIIWR